MRSRFLLGLTGACVALVSFACVTQEDMEFTTVVLVRHAEKVATGDTPMLGASGDDPILTDTGTERARELARVLSEVGVDAIYATQYRRTGLTAQPLADSLGLDVRVMAAGRSEYAQEMVDVIRERHVGEVVLVVSHSNTVPELIDSLGGEPVPVIAEDEYDDLYVVTLAGAGHTALLSLRYGRETP